MNTIDALGSRYLWGLLALIPPAIVLLYFLKLKRQPVEVPSTYLWTRTIEDLHVNSIWQKLRQSLLLFLQLLFVLLAIIACFRPGWRGTELIDERMIFLIDNSASMAASDVQPTRLESAKERVIELIDQMSSRQVAMVISFSDVSRVEQMFSNSRSQLRKRVGRIRQSNHRSDLTEALRAAAGLANPGRTSEENTNDVQVADALPATLYIFSDGGFASIPDFSLGNLEPNYIAIGQPTPTNVGIVTFTAERNPENPEQSQAFARLENYGAEDASVDVSLFLNDILVDAAQVDVSMDDATGVNFDLGAVEEGVLQLEIQNRDDLQLDNKAYAVLNIAWRAEVLLITPGNDSLEFALTTSEALRAAKVSLASPEVLGTPDHQKDTLSGKYDLVIYDQCAPKVMPQANTLFFGNVPPLETWSAGEKKRTPIIIDTDPAHPLTHFVEMADVKWNYEGFEVTGPEGATVLFDADIGPLFVVGHREGYEDAVLGIEIIGPDADGEIIPKTEWPIRRSFPVFVMNVLRYLGGARDAMAVAGVHPGSTITIRPLYDVKEIGIATPSKKKLDITREGQNAFVFSQTEELGAYDVQEGREVTQHFAVNLFDARESDLRPRPNIELGYEEVEGQSALEPARQELWKWILITGVVVLLFEWYVYNKRVYL
jgi:hypothetical protein